MIFGIPLLVLLSLLRGGEKAEGAAKQNKPVFLFEGAGLFLFLLLVVDFWVVPGCWEGGIWGKVFDWRG
jgi:hypothetical protein